MKYPYLLFDADNTLFDFDAAERCAFQILCKTHNLPGGETSHLLYHQCNAEVWDAFERGVYTKDFILTERFRLYLERTGRTGDPAVLNQTYLSALGASAILFPGAAELCRGLAERHSLYLLTNAVESVQRARFEGSAIAPYFQGVFISEAIGYGKPSRAYFDYVFRSVPGLTPENGLVIGDSLSSDIQGANNAGFDSCWFNPTGQPRPEHLRIDYEVRTLEEIRAIADQ